MKSGADVIWYSTGNDGLDAVHHQMDEKNLIKIMGCKGYVHTGSTTEMLPNGKALVRVDFTKN